MAKTATRSVDLEPIDRLEEKVKLLVGMVDRMKASRRARPKKTSACRASSSRCARGWRRATGSPTELTALKEERDVIRTRVGEMLEQLEALEPLSVHGES